MELIEFSTLINWIVYFLLEMELIEGFISKNGIKDFFYLNELDLFCRIYHVGRYLIIG